jgi:hypothetical protein
MLDPFFKDGFCSNPTLADFRARRFSGLEEQAHRIRMAPGHGSGLL